MELAELKPRILKLLREDEEFRYAVAGLIGLGEVLKRLDEHGERMVKLEERMLRVEEELVKLREDMNKLGEDMIRGFERHDKETAELRQEMNKLREDMNKGFELVSRHVDALGTRWGLMAEEAFREGLRGILEKEFGFKVERWSVYDEKGRVFGYPSDVEVDVTIKNGKLILIEVSSHVRASDVYEFKRKAELYAEKTGNKPEKLMLVTPYIEEKAIEASKKLGIEVYTKV